MLNKKVFFISASLPYSCIEEHQILNFGVLKQLPSTYEVHLVNLLRPGEHLAEDNRLNGMCKIVITVPVKLNLLANIKANICGLLARNPNVVSRYVTP